MRGKVGNEAALSPLLDRPRLCLDMPCLLCNPNSKLSINNINGEHYILDSVRFPCLTCLLTHLMGGGGMQHTYLRP